MPHKFFSPKPTLLSHFHNQLNNVSMSFSFDYSLFNIENKSTSRLQDAYKLFRFR